MEDNLKNSKSIISDTSSQVNDFKSELEKIKQKLAQDIYKFSEMGKKASPSKNQKNSNYSQRDDNIMQPIELAEEIVQKKEYSENGEINNEIDCQNNDMNSIFSKVPTVEELKLKYGINFGGSDFNDKSNDKINEKETTENTDNKENKENKDMNLDYLKNFHYMKNNDNVFNNLNKKNAEISNIQKKEEEEEEDDDEIDILFKKKILAMNKVDDDEENDKNENNKEDNEEYNNNINKKDNRKIISKEDLNEINNIIGVRKYLDIEDIEESEDNSKENEIKDNINITEENQNIMKRKDNEEDEMDMINNYIDNSNRKNNMNKNIFNNNIEPQQLLNVEDKIKNDKKNIFNNNTINNKNIQDSNLPKETQETKPSLQQPESEFQERKLNKKDLIIPQSLKNDTNPPNFTSTATANKEKTNINNNNPNSNLDTSLLNSKLEKQIKLIDEKTENNRIEEQKNLQLIKEIENSLDLDKRLTHQNREIRKNAIKEICEMCQNCTENEEDKQKAFDYFSPWIKFCLEETNSYVIPESLNFYLIFNSMFPNFLQSSFKDFFDNIERFLTFGISLINENCFKIMVLLIQDRKMYNLTLNEVCKLINTNSIKTQRFLTTLLISFMEQNVLGENYVKIIFEKVVNIYSKIGLKLTERKKIYSKLLEYIYSIIEDDIFTIKNCIKLNSYKEIENFFNKIKKDQNKLKYRLYPRVEENLEGGGKSMISAMGDNSKTNKYNSYTNNNENNNNTKNNKFSNNMNRNNNKDTLNNLIINNNNSPYNSSSEVNDIVSIMPSDFFEYHFLTQFQTKIKLLEEANSILSKIKSVKDKEKNLTDVYKTINYSIEDSNILIHLEGIKLLENICRLINGFINLQKLKLLLETCFDKLKDKKSLVKNELFNLFNIIIENHCFDIDKFIIFILTFCCNQKKENSQVKIGLLEYIKILFEQKNNILAYENKKIKEKDYFSFSKKIINIIQKESLSSIKDICSDLLIVCKRRISDTEAFYELINVLPNYRKKIIQTEGEAIEGDEGDYKKNLKKIKSSYSFSKTRYDGLGARNRSRSSIRKNDIGNKNDKSNKTNTSFSSSKNINIRNNLRPINNNVKDNDRGNSKGKYNTRTNFKSSKAQTTGFNKFNNKQNRNNSNKSPNNKGRSNKNNSDYNENETTSNNYNERMSSNKKQNNFNSNRKVQKQNKGNKITNIKKINNKEEYQNNNSQESGLEHQNNDMNINNINNNNNKESLDQKKDNLIEKLANLDINSIDKYSKVIIHDFIIFLNKVCSGEISTKEDLSYHFNLIFKILEKILYRIVELMNEHREKENIHKLKKLIDELLTSITKIVILVPCIDQIKGNKKFDLCLLETFLEQLKNFCHTKEKLCLRILLSLFNFCKGESEFPKEIDPKNSVIYFLNYVKQGYLETKSMKLLSVLKEFISETNVINDEEKKKLLINEEGGDETKKKNIEDSFTQNMDEPGEEFNRKENELKQGNNGDKNEEKEDGGEEGYEGNEEQEQEEENEGDNEEEENKIVQVQENFINNRLNNNIVIHSNQNEDMINNINNFNRKYLENKNKLLNNSNNNNKNLDEDNNSNEEEDEEENINNKNNRIISQDNIAQKLKEFENKLNKIPRTQTPLQNSNQKSVPSVSTGYEYEDKKSTPEQQKETFTSTNNNNNTNNSIINKNSKLDDTDFQKIEESIKLMSKRLDNTLNKMNEAAQKRSINNNNNISISRKQNKNPYQNNIITTSNNVLDISKVSEINNNPNNNSAFLSQIGNSLAVDNFSNPLSQNSSNFYIEKIMKVLKNQSTEMEIFSQAKIEFNKFQSVEKKIDFISNLKNSLSSCELNLSLLSISVYLNFYDFLLSILSFQILSNSKEETVIIKLQELAEFLLKFRKLDDMFKVMLFLLKKYFPKNINNKLEDISLVMIKVISYLLKELLKNMNKENVNGLEIICEINDLFTVTPPSSLTTATPNAKFYQHIFTLLKTITDQIIIQNRNQLGEFIGYLQEKKIVCEDYIQYLIRLQRNK